MNSAISMRRMASTISMRRMYSTIKTPVPVLESMIGHLKNAIRGRDEEAGYIHKKRYELLKHLSIYESTLDSLHRQKVDDKYELDDLQKSLSEAKYLSQLSSTKKI